MRGLEGNEQSRTECHPRDEVEGTHSAPPHAALSNRNVTCDATPNREASERADSQTALANCAPSISMSRISHLAILLLVRDGALDSNRPPARHANRRAPPRQFASCARQSFVMLHARTVVTTCRVAETRLARLRRIAASHGESRRAVGDRALNRGPVSREVMRENYLRTFEKCKCE